MDSWPRVGFWVGIRNPSLGFALIRPPAILYSMMTLLDMRLSCRGSTLSSLTRAEALEVGLKSPQLCRSDLLCTISSLSCRCFWWGSHTEGSILQDWSYSTLVALCLDCNRAPSEVLMSERTGPIHLGSDGVDKGILS